LALDRSIAARREELVRRQSARAIGLFELEARLHDPAEYLLMMHFLAEIDQPLERRWPLIFELVRRSMAAGLCTMAATST